MLDTRVLGLFLGHHVEFLGEAPRGLVLWAEGAQYPPHSERFERMLEDRFHVTLFQRMERRLAQ